MQNLPSMQRVKESSIESLVLNIRISLPQSHTVQDQLKITLLLLLFNAQLLLKKHESHC